MPALEIDGRLLFYEERGTGIPLIFIHPPLLTHFTFQRQLEQLSQDYRVICFDIRGHGKSQSSEQPITYSLLAGDVLQLIDHLSLKRVILCGYSTGGSVVLEAMITAPESFAGGIIISGMSEVSDLKLRSRITVAITLLKKKMLPILAASIVITNSDTWHLIWKHFKYCLKGNVNNIKQYYQFCLGYRCTEQLNQIKSPILLVYGSNDRAFHRYAKILHDKLPHNTFRTIQGVDHRIPIKKPVVLHNLIKRWITEMDTNESNESIDVWKSFNLDHNTKNDEKQPPAWP
jgi:pimeloyl-ACP methyl ester carboxylesterase